MRWLSAKLPCMSPGPSDDGLVCPLGAVGRPKRRPPWLQTSNPADILADKFTCRPGGKQTPRS
jgi:hypothetical protein